MSIPRMAWLVSLLLAAPLTWQCKLGVAAEYKRDHHHGSSSSGERPSPSDPLEDRQRRFQRSEGSLQYLDANHNGQIDADEVQGTRKYLWDKFAQRLGLTATFPQSVRTLREGLANWYYLQPDQIPASAAPGSPSPASPSPSSSAGPSTPGFGSGSSSSSSSSGSSVELRVQQYAEGLLRQYDANKSGVLEREEWKNMRGDPESVDTNHDGRITLDELKAKVASYFRGSAAGSSSSGGSSSSSATGSPSSGSSGSYVSRSSGSGLAGSGSNAARTYRSAYHFLSPKERLPSGLPDWFIAKDANGDGQISMAEFSDNWSEEKAREFQAVDLNGDGIITPAECLTKEKRKSPP